jgi:CheY-specific phosphatase CheX
MPMPEIDQLLGRCASGVLATICRDEPLAPGAGQVDDAITAMIPFAGSSSGVFHIDVNERAASLLAHRFLGLPPQFTLSQEEIELVCCELGNMICGSVLSALHSDAGIELRQPRIAAPEPCAPPYRRVFEIQDGLLAVSLNFTTLQ